MLRSNPNVKWFIYLLVDPKVTSGKARDEVRYVGVTDNVKKRLSSHLKDATGDRITHKLNWLRSLSGNPLVRVVDQGIGHSWRAAETYWIRFYREEVGADLTNLTDGGDGCLGYKHTEESIATIKQKNRGKKRSAETILKIQDYAFTAEHRRNISISKQGTKRPDLVLLNKLYTHKRWKHPVSLDDCAACDYQRVLKIERCA
jgi:hypothetical protein